MGVGRRVVTWSGESEVQNLGLKCFVHMCEVIKELIKMLFMKNKVQQ